MLSKLRPSGVIFSAGFTWALAAVPSTTSAQDRSCDPPDPHHVSVWHQRWDTGGYSAAAEFGEAYSGIIRNPNSKGSNTTTGITSFTGAFDLETVELRPARPSLHGSGTLHLRALIDSELQLAIRHQPGLIGNQLLVGVLVGFHRDPPATGNYWPAQSSSDTTPIYLVSSTSAVRFSDDEWQPREDGGGFVVTSSTPDGFQGWWHTPGAVVPPPLGYFCAYPRRE